MSKFKPLSFYEQPLATGYKLLPFRFSSLRDDEYVLTNAVGQYVVLGRSELDAFAKHSLPYSASSYEELKAKHFLLDDDSNVALDLLALKLRTKLQYLQHFTGLHIFVVTLRCEHSCPYCQVSRQSDDRVAYDMSPEDARRALDLVFRSPSPTIKIEFQGGEPLLNFDLIRYIIETAEERATREAKQLQFVITTNLALVTDEILSFCRDHRVLISTSLDGPEDLHNQNRPRPGRNSYRKAIEGIQRAREALGHDRVGALMTTTRSSLPRVREIIDEYLRLEFDGIFLRPLSPYGFAVKTKSFGAYRADEWLRFYFDGLEYILQLNQQGHRFVEHYAATVLTKMLTPFNPGYVDLMSPAGIGIGAVVYNYDGDVYASDEARMLAEMGDKTFRLGNVRSHSFEEIFTSEVLLDALEASFAASAPMCSECAFEPFCGADPVYHHGMQGDFVGKKPLSDFCRRNMAIFRKLIQLQRDRPETEAIFMNWTRH